MFEEQSGQIAPSNLRGVVLVLLSLSGRLAALSASELEQAIEDAKTRLAMEAKSSPEHDLSLAHELLDGLASMDWSQIDEPSPRNN